MTDTIIAQAEPVLVAIDISKARHEVLIAVPCKKRHRRLLVLNQLEDFHGLITTLSNYDRHVRAAFEATGNYHRALAYRLGTGPQKFFQASLSVSPHPLTARSATSSVWRSRTSVFKRRASDTSIPP